MDRGAWKATVHGGRKESDTMEYHHVIPYLRGSREAVVKRSVF